MGRNRDKKKDAYLLKLRSRTKIGKLKNIYRQQISSSKKRGHKHPEYTKEEFINMFIENLDYLRHYYSWVISGYNKEYAPSFDRKDDYKSYSFENIQIMYWHQNRNKYYKDSKNNINKKQLKPVIGTNLITKEKIYFYSMQEAERNGFNHSHISSCCKGKRSKHNGYKWEYKNK